MKRKFWIALLPLCGCFCVEAGAASAVRSMEGRRAPEKVRGYRVRIYFDNVQHARSQAESVMARFREIYPDIPAYMDYDNIPYFKVTVGNCLTMEEAIILWGIHRAREHASRAFRPTAGRTDGRAGGAER